MLWKITGMVLGLLVIMVAVCGIIWCEVCCDDAPCVGGDAMMLYDLCGFVL